MTDSHFHITETIAIPWSELTFTAVRGSGPGGQNVNKVASKVLLRWQFAESTALPEAVRTRFLAANRNRLNAEGQILITSEESRDQPTNKENCLDKLSEMITKAITPPKKRKPTKPTRGSQQRRLQAKKQRSETKKNRRPDID